MKSIKPFFNSILELSKLSKHSETQVTDCSIVTTSYQMGDQPEGIINTNRSKSRVEIDEVESFEPITHCPLRVFLCYSSSDKPIVRGLHRWLLKNGFDPWLDEENLLPGQDWANQIAKAVHTSDIVIVCLSRDSITKRGYVHKEIKLALDAADEQPEDAIFVIPVRLEKCTVPDRLRRWQWVDLYDEKGYERLLRALLVQSDFVEMNSLSCSVISNSANLMSYDFKIVLLDQSGQIIKRYRSTAQHFIEDLDYGVKLEMVKIPGGTFLMGSPGKETERDTDEGPQHQVIVSSFFMGKFEVTQAQWGAIAKLPKYHRDLSHNPSRFKGENRPVEQVSWDEAIEFCARLSHKTGKKYRLPSESEWEYACRAGTNTPFHFGEMITPEVANYDGAYPYKSSQKGLYREQTTVVGSMGFANSFGLYDMHGNVWEWCLDSWHENYVDAPIDGSAWESGDSSLRVIRGGSWSYIGSCCRSASRDKAYTGFSYLSLGFRLIMHETEK